MSASNGRLLAPAATREEAAAIIAALERFMRATAPSPAATAPGVPDPWTRVAIREGVERGAQEELRDPWTSG